MAFSIRAAEYAAPVSCESQNEKRAGSAARRFARPELGQAERYQGFDACQYTGARQAIRHVLPIRTIAVAYCKAIEKFGNADTVPRLE